MLLNKKVFKFLFIGGTTALIYYSLLYLTKEVFKLHHNISLTISYFISISFHFLMNKFFVFKERQISSLGLQLPKYALLNIINYLISLGVVNLLLLFSINIYIGVFISTSITLILTYSFMNKLIFKNKTYDGIK